MRIYLLQQAKYILLGAGKSVREFFGDIIENEMYGNSQSAAMKVELSSEQALFIQEIVNEIRKFNISVRKEENEARKADNLVPLPEEESYPTGYFKSLHLFWKMIKVIRGAAKQEPSKKREFSEQRKEAGKVFKIIIAEWILANLGFAAIFGYWVLPEIIAVLPIFGVLGCIPFIILGY
jgi:hypothetical protein